jgi:uroporphyrinogen III methyltransferase/synthase
MNVDTPLLLQGCRLFILRSVEQSPHFSEPFKRLGAEVILYPTLTFNPIEEALQKITLEFLAPFTAIIWTSTNGVRFFMQGLSANGLEVSSLVSKTLIPVGPKTAQCLTSFGVVPSCMPTHFSAQGILRALPRQLQGQHFLLAVAAQANPELEQSLLERSAKVTTLKLYHTSPPLSYPSENLNEGDYVLFTSPSTVYHFFDSPLYQKQVFVAFCLGTLTAQALQKKGYDPIISPQATLDSLVETLIHVHQERRDEISRG